MLAAGLWRWVALTGRARRSSPAAQTKPVVFAWEPHSTRGPASSGNLLLGSRQGWISSLRLNTWVLSFITQGMNTCLAAWYSPLQAAQRKPTWKNSSHIHHTKYCIQSNLPSTCYPGTLVDQAPFSYYTNLSTLHEKKKFFWSDPHDGAATPALSLDKYASQ